MEDILWTFSVQSDIDFCIVGATSFSWLMSTYTRGVFQLEIYDKESGERYIRYPTALFLSLISFHYDSSQSKKKKHNKNQFLALCFTPNIGTGK